MIRTLTLAAILSGAATLAIAGGHKTPAPENASVRIVSPEDGATVTNPVTIVFGLDGMGVAPAGTEVENTGHHHLLINISPDEINMDEPLPATDQIVHFGGGQTQVTTDLPAGEHEIRLLLGDWSHVPHDPPVMSETITIVVE